MIIALMVHYADHMVLLSKLVYVVFQLVLSPPTLLPLHLPLLLPCRWLSLCHFFSSCKAKNTENCKKEFTLTGSEARRVRALLAPLKALGQFLHCMCVCVCLFVYVCVCRVPLFRFWPTWFECWCFAYCSIAFTFTGYQQQRFRNDTDYNTDNTSPLPLAPPTLHERSAFQCSMVKVEVISARNVPKYTISKRRQGQAKQQCKHTR